MTRYASSDIHSFMNANCPSGGHMRKITNQREVNKGADPIYADERLVVNCPVCEPLLRAKDSWSSDPMNVPLTESERLAEEARERQVAKDRIVADQAQAEMAREWLAEKAPRRAS